MGPLGAGPCVVQRDTALLSSPGRVPGAPGVSWGWRLGWVRVPPTVSFVACASDVPGCVKEGGDK